MVERGEHARFTLEARQAVGSAVNGARQDLDRHIAAEPRIAGAIDLAHSTRANAFLQLVDADPPARQHGSGPAAHQLRGRCERGRGQESFAGVW